MAIVTNIIHVRCRYNGLDVILSYTREDAIVAKGRGLLRFEDWNCNKKSQCGNKDCIAYSIVGKKKYW